MPNSNPWSDRRSNISSKDSFFGSSNSPQQPPLRVTAIAGVTTEAVHQIVARPLADIVNSLQKAAAVQQTPANRAGHEISAKLAAKVQQEIHPTSNAVISDKAAASVKSEPEPEAPRPTM